jgi:hypothetical protein
MGRSRLFMSARRPSLQSGKACHQPGQKGNTGTLPKEDSQTRLHVGERLSGLEISRIEGWVGWELSPQGHWAKLMLDFKLKGLSVAFRMLR